jgi:cytoskeletal protein CcmA (bactofilin family)
VERNGHRQGAKDCGQLHGGGAGGAQSQVEGEIHCTSLIVSRQAQVVGTIQAERVVVDGSVEGPIRGGQVILKSQAGVVGDIHHQSLAIERGALFDGRSVQGNVQRLEAPEVKPAKQIPKTRETPHQERISQEAGEGRDKDRTSSPTA